VKTLLKNLASLALGPFYVFRPMGRRYRYTQIIRCPESGQLAQIVIDNFPGVAPRPRKKAASVRACSLWPIKKDCGQSCVTGRRPY
jgi:hypothetical protein